MLHALFRERGVETGRIGESAMTAWGSEKGLKPPEPNTRATSPAPQGSHTTTTQVDTRNTQDIMEASREAEGRDVSTGKGTEVKRV